MRKRYQKIHKRGQTELEREIQGKKDGTFREEDRYKKKSREDSDDKYKSDRFDDRREPLAMALASKDIPPQIKSVMRLMLAPRQKNKQQANSGKLIRLMAFACFFMFGVNIILGGGVDVGRTAKDAFNFVFIFGIIAAVLIPVALVTMKLEAFMSQDNAARVGAGIIIGLVFLFLYWLASNWGY